MLIDRGFCSNLNSYSPTYRMRMKLNRDDQHGKVLHFRISHQHNNVSIGNVFKLGGNKLVYKTNTFLVCNFCELPLQLDCIVNSLPAFRLDGGWSVQIERCENQLGVGTSRATSASEWVCIGKCAFPVEWCFSEWQ